MFFIDLFQSWSTMDPLKRLSGSFPIKPRPPAITGINDVLMFHNCSVPLKDPCILIFKDILQSVETAMLIRKHFLFP